VTNGEHDGNGEPPVRPGDDGEPELDVDSVFAAIVAAWGEEADDGPGSWPEAEDLDPPASGGGATPPPGAADRADPAADDDEPRDRPGDGEIVLPAVVLGGGSLTSSTVGPRDADPNAPTRAEEGYVPPEPPPLPRGDLLTRALWAGVIGGPLFLVIAAIAWRDAPRILILAAVAAFVGGFVMLVVRMPHDREDDGDDGAVV